MVVGGVGTFFGQEGESKYKTLSPSGLSLAQNLFLLQLLPIFALLLLLDSH